MHDIEICTEHGDCVVTFSPQPSGRHGRIEDCPVCSRFSEIESEKEDLEGEAKSLRSQVRDLEDEVSALKSEIDDLRDQVEKLEAQL